MADGSKIEWTDATWNPVTGCSVTSPGCTNCYAMQLAGTRLRHHPSREGLTRQVNGNHVWTGDVRFNEQWLTDPLRWRRPRRIFVCAHGDLFHENVPDEWIDCVFAVMALCPQHTFQVLTKRADRMREYCTTIQQFGRWLYMESIALDLGRDPRGEDNDGFDFIANHQFLPNVWLGVSVEDQQRADERIPDLLATPAAVRFLSCEPLLGPVDLNRIHEEFDGGLGQKWESALNGLRFSPWADIDEDPMIPGYPKLDWVIVGGESGPDARPMHPDWARSLRDQCQAAGVPFFFKQWGEWGRADELTDGTRLETVFTTAAPKPNGIATSCAWPDGSIGQGHADDHGGNGIGIQRVGKKRAGRLLDGREWNEMPAGAAP